MSSFRSCMFAAATVAATLLLAMPASANECHAPAEQRMVDGCTAIIDHPAATEQDRYEATRLRGVAHFYMGHMDLALADFSALVLMHPDKPYPYNLRAQVYNRLHDYERSIADSSKAIEVDATFAVAWFDRGVSFEEKGDLAHAMTDYNEAIRLQPGKGIYVRTRGLLRRRNGDMPGAIADLSEALRLDPKDQLALVFRATTYRFAKDYDKALVDYDAVLKVRPNDNGSYAGRAEMRMARGDNDGAIADFGRALAIRPDNVEAYVDRGIVFARKGDFASAIPDYDAALKLTPDDATIRNRRAHAAFIVGNFAAAAADFGDVVEKTPQYDLAKLLRYIARARSGDFDSGELARNTASLDRQGWPWPAVAVYLGEMKIDEMIVMTKDMHLVDDFRDCGVAFYLGEYLLVRKRRDEALPYLKQAAQVCRGDGEFERDAAKGELSRW